MARKSKHIPPAAAKSANLWKPAFYLRLSLKDGDKAESDSITNQRSLLAEFAAGVEDLAEPVFYQDDGFTGTNFDRLGFQSMLADLRTGKCTCVIVKDDCVNMELKSESPQKCGFCDVSSVF